jgi:hypothetical protein
MLHELSLRTSANSAFQTYFSLSFRLRHCRAGIFVSIGAAFPIVQSAFGSNDLRFAESQWYF